MNNIVFLHATAIKLGKREIGVAVNVSASGGSEQNAITSFQTAHARVFGVRVPSHEIRLIAARPVADTQRLINAVKKFTNKKNKGVHVEVLRKNSYNAADGKLKGMYCPDAHRHIKNLVKQMRG